MPSPIQIHGFDNALEPARMLRTRVKVVAERHQAPFTAHLVEATKEEVPISRTAFDRAEGMFDDSRSTAHQLVSGPHPGAMTLEDILMLPAMDDASICVDTR